MIPYGRQDINDEDIAAVVDVLRSDFLTQGPVVPLFEQALSARVQAKHGVAMNSATSALHVAVAALGLAPGEWLWTQPITFVASANCALYCGAKVDFVDIDADTFTMCPKALAEKLSMTPAERLPKIVMPVHMAGQSAAMQEIAALGSEYGFKIIEDASHAIGADYNGPPVGACSYSDAAVFSFHPVKIITTGEGGMVSTNNAMLAERMRTLRSHGITKQKNVLEYKDPPPWYYEQQSLGWNYRMTDIQAALGLSQFSRLDSFVNRRNALAARYDEFLADLPLLLPRRRADSRSAFHLYIVRLSDPDAQEHRRAFEALRAGGIGVQLHYMPVHLQPYFKALGFKENDFPVAEAYAQSAISLPLFPALTHTEQDIVVATLRQVLA